MIALIQRVTQGRVTIDGTSVGAIGAGLVALVCAERDDGEAQADALVSKVLGYRVFEDDRGKMNFSVRDVDGGLLAAPPERGERLFHRFVEHARARHGRVEAGRFGARMQVQLVNDGPVTFWLQTRAKEDSK